LVQGWYRGWGWVELFCLLRLFSRSVRQRRRLPPVCYADDVCRRLLGALRRLLGRVVISWVAAPLLFTAAASRGGDLVDLVRMAPMPLIR